MIWWWYNFSLSTMICIMFGYFNMIEKFSNKLGGIPNRWANIELEVWFLIKNKLGFTYHNSYFSSTNFIEII